MEWRSDRTLQGFHRLLDRAVVEPLQGTLFKMKSRPRVALRLPWAFEWNPYRVQGLTLPGALLPIADWNLDGYVLPPVEAGRVDVFADVVEGVGRYAGRSGKVVGRTQFEFDLARFLADQLARTG